MVRLLQDDFQIVDFDLDAVDGEVAIGIGFFRRREFQGEGQSMAAHEEIYNTSIPKAREPALFMDIVDNILDIALDLGSMHRKVMFALGFNARTFESVKRIGLNFEDIGHQILGFDDNILDYSVQCKVMDFNAGYLVMRDGKKTIIPECIPSTGKIQG